MKKGQLFSWPFFIPLKYGKIEFVTKDKFHDAHCFDERQEGQNSER
ncbi:hypothetical protein [Photobacterium sp. 1_MG-2023]|nr:hypothetical protein [Photobacterium sp. 1_MG-2023]MDO6708611.1 hypothetical protein [Photobacterium sp. 1_MG-2023]